MHLLSLLVASLLAFVSCRGVPIEPQPPVEDAQEIFLEAASEVESALRAIVNHSSSVVSTEEVLREADDARDIYLEDFVSAVTQLKAVLQTEQGGDDVTAEEYRAGVMHELHSALKRISLTKNQILSLVLGEDVMQADGARLEISLRLLESLVERLAGTSDLGEVSLATVRKVSAVVDAAMEALHGVRDAAQDAEEDAEGILESAGVLTPPVIEDGPEEESDDVAKEKGDTGSENNDVTDESDDSETGNHARGSRNRRQVRPPGGPYLPARPSYPNPPPRVNLNLPSPSRGLNIPTSVNIGGGWSAGLKGVSYNRGNFHFNVKPTFGGGLPPRIKGAHASVRIEF